MPNEENYTQRYLFKNFHVSAFLYLLIGMKYNTAYFSSMLEFSQKLCRHWSYPEYLNCEVPWA